METYFAALTAQWSRALRWLLPQRVWPYLDTGLGHFILLMLVIVPLLITVFAMVYRQELSVLADMASEVDLLKYYKQFTITLQQIFYSNNLLSCPLKNFIFSIEEKLTRKRIRPSGEQEKDLLLGG